MISKSISTSAKLSEVSTFAALLFTWTIPHCDDYGHMDADPKIVKAVVVPLRAESVQEVGAALQELEHVGLVRFYSHTDEGRERRYLEVVKWSEHQTLKNDRPAYIAYPLPTGWNPVDSNGFLEAKGSKAKRSKGKGTSSARGTKKTAAEEAATQEEKDIGQVIDAFRAVNPTYQLLFSQRPQREAARRLLRLYALDKVLRTVAMLETSNASTYAPTITTPVVLERRLGDLIAWWRKEQARGQAKGRGIIGLTD